MRSVFTLSLYLILLPFFVKSQDIDSLHNELKNTTEASALYGKLLARICHDISEYNPDSAIYYCNEAIKWSDKYQIDSIKGRSLIGLSAAHSYKGNHRKSIELTYEAIEIATQIKDSITLLDAFNGLGIDLYYLEDYEGAEKYWARTAELAAKTKFYSREAHSYNNLALLDVENEKFSKAIKRFKKALQIFRRIKDKHGIANTSINLANAQIQLERYNEAITNLQTGLSLYESLQWPTGQVDALTNWAKAEFKRGNLQKASELISRSMDLAEKNELDLLQKMNYELAHKIYRSKGDNDKAYQYLLRFHENYKSSKETEQLEAIALMKEQFESEEREQVIKNLENENRIKDLQAQQEQQFRWFLIFGAILLFLALILIYQRFRLKSKTGKILEDKNEQLSELNSMKNRLFSIIAHDLRSPLSALSMLVGSLKENSQDLSREELDEYLGTILDSSGELNKLLVNLLDWARIQSDNLIFNPQKNSIKATVDQAFEPMKLSAGLKNITFINEATDEGYYDDQMMITVLRNLIANAIKFTSEGGRIKVETFSNDHFNIFSVRDNGEGMSEEQLNNLFLSPNRKMDSANQGTGLGLILCKELVERHGGEIKVNSALNEGAEFSIYLPRDENGVMVA